MTAICKKFGKFPEGLCQIYICQVLEGLLYLHDQGVIHRDIKGSNILATKEGSIKLADFGVATRVGGHDRSVVGSPYWMAPEVVEQSGATTASDIWSVGCVVIELLEGQPPYHELEPMPALFRIVNDDCPPLPDSASPVVRDFLLQCFQKDSNLRISARKLLKHPWMVAARKQLDQTKLRLSSSSPSNLNLLGASRRNFSAYDETVQRVQAWNKVLDKQQPPRSAQTVFARSPASRASEDVASALHQATDLLKAPVGRIGKTVAEELTRQPASPVRTARNGLSSEPQILKNLAGSNEDKENDNWDSDFLDDIPAEKKSTTDAKFEKGPAEERSGVPDNTATIRPASMSPLGVRASRAKHMSTVVEDWSDLVPEEEVKPFAGRLSDMRVSVYSFKDLDQPSNVIFRNFRSRANPRSVYCIPETCPVVRERQSRLLHLLEMLLSVLRRCPKLVLQRYPLASLTNKEGPARGHRLANLHSSNTVNPKMKITQMRSMTELFHEVAVIKDWS